MEPSQDFAAYPRSGPALLPSGIAVLAPGFHWRAIADAWSLFQAQWRVWIGAMLVFLAINEPVEFLFKVIDKGHGRHSFVLDLCESFAMGVVPGLVSVTLRAGLGLMALRQLRGLPIRVTGVFGGRRYVQQLLILTVSEKALSLVGLGLLVVPGIWIMGALSMSLILIIDQDRNALEAMKQSWSIVGTSSLWLGLIPLSIAIIDFLIQTFVTHGIRVPIWEPWSVLFFCLHYCYFCPKQFGSASVANGGLSTPA